MWKQENDTRHIYMESIKGFESLHSQFFHRIYAFLNLNSDNLFRTTAGSLLIEKEG